MVDRNDLSLRVLSAAAIAIVALCYATARAIHEPASPTDFDQLWHAARALLDGRDPYAVVGPKDRSFYWPWPLYYPLPAILLTSPLAGLPVAAARVAFTTIASLTLAWSMGPRILALWPLILSAAFVDSMARTQWSPLILAACWVPSIGFLVAAKPNMGLGALVVHLGDARALRQIVVGALALLALSFVARPDWLLSWWAAIADAPHLVPPIARPGGILLAAAALRWKRPEARLFLVLSCVPQTPSLYELLPLFFVCRQLRQALALAVLTQVLFFGFTIWGSASTFSEYVANLGRAAIWIVYLPVLGAILARPNRVEAPLLTVDGSWRAAIPANVIDVILSVLLMMSAFLQAWLPFAAHQP